MERIVSSTRPQIVPFIQVSSPTYFRKINNIVWSLTLFVFLIGFYIGLIPFMCGLCLARLRNSIADETALKTNNIELEESLTPSSTYLRKINNIVCSWTLFIFLMGLHIGLSPFICGFSFARLHNNIVVEITLKTNNIKLEESLVNINNEKDQCFHCFINNTTFDELEILQ
ncbi:unnamed protein product [Rotaria sordida]|uniref:Uncharacterized protein n=1 Tax=Rotaria sordida TaxID=392033 RepID=A0A815QAX9_9BILA|nr:unnamed protein product [Rotaria sordida]